MEKRAYGFIFEPHVTVQVRDDDDAIIWTMVGVYGWLEANNKHLTRSMMREILSIIVGPVTFFLETSMLFYML